MSKGERVNRVRNELWTEEEVVRRLPEIDYIYDDDLRDGVIYTYLRACPDYFWERPSSSSGKYHSVDERGRRGNWIHVKRVFAEYVNLSRSWEELGLISAKDRERGKAAALLHDMMKYGWPSEDREHTTDEHDLIIADVAKNIGMFDDTVVSVLARHMGPWGSGPEPHTKEEILLHTADMSASRASNDIGIYEPAEEILEEWPDITVDEWSDDE